MSTVKTLENDDSVEDFIGSVDNAQRQQDGFVLLDVYKKATGQKPKMWGSSIIGFGKYHYKHEKSGQEADWPLAAFSPRKQNLTLYVMPQQHDLSNLLSVLGKHKTSKACLYINKLDDVDLKVLEEIIKKSYFEAMARLLN